MTLDEYRRLALSLPEVAEGSHMEHPDFRVRNKIFATLWPKQLCGVVMLTSEQQSFLVDAEPTIFAPVSGGWGRRGATVITLEHADTKTVRSALLWAWQNKAPEGLALSKGPPSKRTGRKSRGKRTRSR